MKDDQTGAAGIVSNKFATAQNYAQEAWQSAEAFLLRLGTMASLEYPFARIAEVPDAPQFPSAPSFSGISAPTAASASAPDGPDIEALDLERFDLPEFSVSPPDVFLPDPPEETRPAAPGEAPAAVQVDLPEAPAVVLPDPPVFDPVELPDMPGFIVPNFEGERPSVPSMTPPGNLFVFEEGGYVSPVREALRERLLAALARDGAGLGAEAEQAVWERGRERFRQELEERLAEIQERFSAMNCALPPGPMNALTSRAYDDYFDKMAGLDREIMLGQAELARQDGQASLDKALAFESQEIDLFNAVAGRAFERARALAQFGYEALNAEVNVHNAQLAAYQADGAVFEARVRAAVSGLEAYKIRMEGAVLAADVQTRAVELYKAQIAGTNALIETYKARMQGAALAAEAGKQRIMAYESQVQAYVAGVNANTAAYNAYAARIAGEEAKARVYGEQVGAWAEYVKTAKAQSELALSAKTEENRLRIEKYKADVAKFQAQTQAAMDQAQLLLKVEETRVRAFEAQTGAVGLEIDAKSKEYGAKVDAYLKSAEVSIKEADMLLQNSLNAMRLEAEKIKSGAQISAQMAASALSSVNASAQIGYTESKGERTNSSVTESTQRSSSESSTRSTGFRESISHNYNYRT